MATIIVVTNFSDASRNALEYSCNFMAHSKSELLLLSIYSFSATLSSDAMAMAAMSETIATDAQKLQEEVTWVKTNHPSVSIRSELVSGVFLEELRRKVIEEDAHMVIMGAGGTYSELLSWDVNIVDAFVDLKTPVLVVPGHVRYRPVKKIAFACNYFRKNLQAPVAMIRRMVQYTGAALYVINVVSPAEIIDEVAVSSKKVLQDSLADLSPSYFEPAFENIFEAIDGFTEAENIDILMVIPTRHGLWYRIFQQSHTRGLVYLNRIPVLSLHQVTDFI